MDFNKCSRRQDILKLLVTDQEVRPCDTISSGTSKTVLETACPQNGLNCMYVNNIIIGIQTKTYSTWTNIGLTDWKWLVIHASPPIAPTWHPILKCRLLVIACTTSWTKTLNVLLTCEMWTPCFTIVWVRKRDPFKATLVECNDCWMTIGKNGMAHTHGARQWQETNWKRIARISNR